MGPLCESCDENGSEWGEIYIEIDYLICSSCGNRGTNYLNFLAKFLFINILIVYELIIGLNNSI